MKQKFLLAFAAFASIWITSCVKNEQAVPVEEPVTASERAYQDFATLLSRAVYREPALRAFLKNEALRTFDKDYDVFYPWTKDKLVDGERTFREVLTAYDEEGKLKGIENCLPLLTILVPDFSWIHTGCFSVTTWDTEDPNVAVTFDTRAGDYPLYGNGTVRYTMDAGSFPEQAVLVLKQNERMHLSAPATKSGEPVIEFVDPVFDASQSPGTKSGPYYTEHDLGTLDEDNCVEYRELRGRILYAYYTVNGATNGLTQRDYIYYNMTSSQTSGSLDNSYYERIYKMRLCRPNASAWFDDQTPYHEDFSLNSISNTGQNAKKYSDSELKAYKWGEGNLEFQFDIIAGDESMMFRFDVTFAEAFHVKKVTEKTEYNWLGALMYRNYSFDKDTDLEARWINVDVRLFPWNISTVPDKYRIIVHELDSGATIESTIEEDWKKVHEFSVSANLGSDSSLVKIGPGYKATKSYDKKTTYKLTYKEDSDKMVEFSVQYTDPIVTAPGTRSQIKVYSFGDMEFMLLPDRD